MVCRQTIPTQQDSNVYQNFFVHKNSDSNILATVEEANQVEFLEEDCYHGHAGGGTRSLAVKKIPFKYLFNATKFFST
jgi:hypothetical protein